MVPAERFRTVQVYFPLLPNGSERFKRHRTIPNYPELFRTKFELYFFGAVLPPNGSEGFKCIEKTCIKKSTLLCKL